VILPLSKPAMAAVGTFAFIGNWNDLLTPLIFTNSEEMYPLTVGLARLLGRGELRSADGRRGHILHPHIPGLPVFPTVFHPGNCPVGTEMSAERRGEGPRVETAPGFNLR